MTKSVEEKVEILSIFSFHIHNDRVKKPLYLKENISYLDGPEYNISLEQEYYLFFENKTSGSLLHEIKKTYHEKLIFH